MWLIGYSQQNSCGFPLASLPCKQQVAHLAHLTLCKSLCLTPLFLPESISRCLRTKAKCDFQGAKAPLGTNFVLIVSFCGNESCSNTCVDVQHCNRLHPPMTGATRHLHSPVSKFACLTICLSCLSLLSFKALCYHCCAVSLHCKYPMLFLGQHAHVQMQACTCQGSSAADHIDYSARQS